MAWVHENMRRINASREIDVQAGNKLNIHRRHRSTDQVRVCLIIEHKIRPNIHRISPSVRDLMPADSEATFGCELRPHFDFLLHGIARSKSRLPIHHRLILSQDQLVHIPINR